MLKRQINHLAEQIAAHQDPLWRELDATFRDLLFIVASVDGRYEPDFIAFQQKLKQAGKPPKVVRIAPAHKLLVRLNAKARNFRKQQNRPLAA